MLKFEKKAEDLGFRFIIGIDEAGRGPLAGPVVASAVALKKTTFKNKIRDSKKISSEEREDAFHEIFENAYVGIGVACETVIDSHNILNATFYAMTQAVGRLIERLPAEDPGSECRDKQIHLLIDGNLFRSDLPYSYQTIIKGDDLSLSVACASIVAKVTRDRMLRAYDQIFPQYGFKQHKGYPTPEHKAAIKEHGLSMIHRRTFNSI